MAETKIEKIDKLFENANEPPITEADAATNGPAIGIIQELLTCQGYPGMPTETNPVYGRFGKKTKENLKKFRIKHGLQTADAKVEIDHATLRRLAQEPATSPRASRGYLALALDIEITGLIRILSFVTLAEGAGKFAAFNANTDTQGLSYGIIQWAQRPGRLTEILVAFQTGQPELFNSIFGATGADMITHTRRVNGGVRRPSGETLNRNFDLIRSPWKERFLNAALSVPLQKIQVETAAAAFRATITNLRTYATAIRSHRGYGFMLDLANQHGDAGARSVYTRVVTAQMTEDQALQAMSDESYRRVLVQYPLPRTEAAATRHRRELFRTTTLLSTADFNEE
jgi:hypothetical protein